jgi:nucleoside-diphosphate-sugar epimerase
MEDVSRWSSRMDRIDAAVLLATSWGHDAHAINVEATLALSDALSERGVRRLIYFGTASILDAKGAPFLLAHTSGTPYIASKAECRNALLARWPSGLTIVHPTLVIANGADRPASHLTKLLREIDRRSWLARWITGSASFHLVHAADLARMVASLVRHPADETSREVIVGAPPTSLALALDLLLERAGRSRLASIDLTPRRVERLIRLFRIQLSPWDRHCLALRHFTYDDACLTLDPDRPARYPTAREILATIPRDAA